MNSPAQSVELERAEVERVWTCHVAAAPGERWHQRDVDRAIIREFLASVSVAEPAGTRRLLVDRAAVLRWMIQAVQGKTVAYMAQRLATLDRFLKVLTQAGLLETDLLAAYRSGYGKPSWCCLVRALQSEEPEAALATLRLTTAPAGPLAAYLPSYLDLRRSLGRECESYASALNELDHFLQAQAVPSVQAVTPALINSWVAAMTCGAHRRRHKVRCARHFFDHLRSLSVVTDNPALRTLTDAGRLPSSSFKPFLFTKEQVAAILAEARRLPDTAKCRYRGPTCATMLALLYTLGLRHGEVRRLRIQHLDLRQQVLFIAQTKFHKSRFVPFGPKLGQSLQRYLDVRRLILPPLRDDDPLFVTAWRKPIASRMLLTVFRQILHALGIARLPGQARPRLHDLRHAFAAHRLLRWYREGLDVQSRLPALATFMGHIEPRSTEVYLTITAELLHEANTRFHQHFGPPSEEETSP